MYSLQTLKCLQLVSIATYCDAVDEKILVVEDASNGYLRQYLINKKDKSILTWEKRFAYGLKYLHHEMEDQKSVINRDFTTISIDLDENFGAKIVDFGRSMFLSSNQDSLYLNSLCGTVCYVDPEYLQSSKLTRESDV
ncbi:probable serine/threonine-protein kinase PBL28 [Rutidosis leptorrhynchoides]|uniref:probable serine/threonine-protein kinase PBL28 n=1 Tax=Rutidosis leptorrhynchoides TaxID=125765 RepID=UPI003A98EF11